MAKPLLAVIIAGLASNVECPVLQWLAMSEAARRPIRMAERVGFVRLRAARYGAISSLAKPIPP